MRELISAVEVVDVRVPGFSGTRRLRRHQQRQGAQE